MKKMVVLSLLVLSFPLAAFADTSESIPAETVGTSQEQVIESNSVPEETGVDDELSTVPTETQASSEETVESQETATEDTAIKDTATKETTKKDAAKEVPTAETSTVETKQAEKDVELSTEKNVTTTAAQAQNASAKKAQSIPELEKELNAEWTANKFRESLKKDNYGIDQVELTAYSDEELENAGRLFTRYNFDVTGMDLGSYVRVLRMIYKDKEVSWAEVEKALMFNPHDFQTTAELANNIDQLQYYLRVLHPGIRHFSNDELSYILNQLSGSEKELSAAISLFSGILFRLNDYPEITLPTNDMAKPVATIQNLAATTKPIVQSVTTIPNTTAAVKSDLSAQAAGQKEYPKTGERSTTSLTIIGIAVFLLAGLVILKRRVHVK